MNKGKNKKVVIFESPQAAQKRKQTVQQNDSQKNDDNQTSRKDPGQNFLNSHVEAIPFAALIRITDRTNKDPIVVKPSEVYGYE